ncbi:MAG: hypothetical protein K0S74_1099 [Chlamydiales bacterium]|jgi:hypothetical protein|nr:hypothetical protein [Chlamydiales bacterium]
MGPIKSDTLSSLQDSIGINSIGYNTEPVPENKEGLHAFQQKVEAVLTEKNLFIQKLADPLLANDPYFNIHYTHLKQEYQSQILIEDNFNEFCLELQEVGNCAGQAWAFLKQIHNQEFINELTRLQQTKLNFQKTLSLDLKKWIDPQDVTYLHYITINQLNFCEQQVIEKIEKLGSCEQASFYQEQFKKLGERTAHLNRNSNLEEYNLSKTELTRDITKFFQETLGVDINDISDDIALKVCDLIAIKKDVQKRQHKKFELAELAALWKNSSAFFVNLDEDLKGESAHALAVIQPKPHEWFLYDTTFGLAYFKQPEAIMEYLRVILEFFEKEHNIVYDKLVIQSLAKA